MTNDTMGLATLTVFDGVATLTLDDPQTKNALSVSMRDGIEASIAAVHADPRIRALVITGAGGAFCSGGDLRDLGTAQMDSEGWRNRLRKTHGWITTLLNLDCPVIAAVDGVSFGAGFSLALAADFIIASPQARFCMSFLRVGLIPDLGALYTLPRIVGSQRAKELILSAREMDAEEAKQLGIVTEIHPTEVVNKRAAELARSFVTASPTAVSLAKRILAASLASDLRTLLEMEADSQALALNSGYFRDACARFINKEPPSFRYPDSST